MKRKALLGLSVLLVMNLTACVSKPVEVDVLEKDNKVNKTEITTKEDVKEETVYNLTDEDKTHREDRLTGKYKWYLDNRKLAYGVPYFETYAFFDDLGDLDLKTNEKIEQGSILETTAEVIPNYLDINTVSSWNDLVGYGNELPTVTDLYIEDKIKVRALKNFKESSGTGYFAIQKMKDDGTPEHTFEFPFTVNQGLTMEYKIETTLEELERFNSVFNSKSATETIKFLKETIKVHEEEANKAAEKKKEAEKTADTVNNSDEEKTAEPAESTGIKVVISNVDLEKSDEYVDTEEDTAFVKSLVSFMDERGFFAIGEQAILIGDYNYYEGESNSIAPNHKDIMFKKSDTEIQKWREGLRKGLLDASELTTNIIYSQSANYGKTHPTMERIELIKDKVGDQEIDLSRFEFRYNNINYSKMIKKNPPRQVTVVKTKLKPSKIVQ